MPQILPHNHSAVAESLWKLLDCNDRLWPYADIKVSKLVIHKLVMHSELSFQYMVYKCLLTTQSGHSQFMYSVTIFNAFANGDRANQRNLMSIYCSYLGDEHVILTLELFMNKLLALFVFVMTAAFVFNVVLADDHGSKKMDKPQHKEMKKAAKDKGKAHENKKQGDDDEEDNDRDNDREHHNDKKMDREHDDHDMDRDKSDKKGLDKQHEKKADQERKEEGKGSEQGQASREEHSRKWWKFWEE